MARKKIEPVAEPEQVMTDQTVTEEQKATASPVVQEERRAPRQ